MRHERVTRRRPGASLIDHLTATRTLRAVRALRRFTVRAQLPAPLAAAADPRDEPAVELASAHAGPVRLARSTRPGSAAGTTRSGCSARSRRPGSPSSRRTPRPSSRCVSSPTTSRPTWVNRAGTRTSARTTRACPTAVGYFSMEFGVSEVLPNYSGGLGVLAGDHLKAASDLGVPLIARRPALPRRATSASRSSLDGWQLETYPVLDPQGLPLHLLTDETGAPVLVEVPMPGGRMLSARVWRAAVGRVPLLLLDSDIEENEADLRGVTDRLYGGDQDHRIRQEILVGDRRRAGRARLLRGHRAPRARGLPHQRGTRGLPGPGAHPRAAGRRGARLRRGARGRAGRHGVHHAHAGAGGHRPVPARHGPPLLRRRREGRGPAAGRARPTGCSRSAPRTTRACSTWRTWACGWPSAPTACRSCTARCRAACSAALWSGFDAAEVPIGSVTNGVHGHTWEAREITELLGAPQPAGAPYAGPAAVGRSTLWELRTTLRAPAGRRGAPPGARGVAAARCVRAGAGLDRPRLRPGRAHRRLRPARARPTSGSR